MQIYEDLLTYLVLSENYYYLVIEPYSNTEIEFAKAIINGQEVMIRHCSDGNGNIMVSEKIEFDNLPDSYFSPKEWEKFLKLRGNEMWINIAIECSEFRIEHQEEYEKCSNMLQAIMDNRSLE